MHQLIFVLLILQYGIILSVGQLTPVLIGEDAFTPPFVYCVNPDILFPTIITDCDPFRSDGCNVDNYRCKLANALSTVNSTTQLITFNVVHKYAALMPGYRDGKAYINIRYTDLRNQQFSGVLQLFKKKTGSTNLFEYYQRQHEVNYASLLTLQTFLFHQLEAGRYVAVFWDDGGTRYASGNPEISQEFEIYNIFTQKVRLYVEAMPISTYDTDYKRTRRNFISYRLHGPINYMATLTTACTTPGYYRCPVWEHRSDQGNIINAKTELETVPPQAVLDGFVDDMFKFKTFPIMHNKRSKIAFRLTYGGPSPFFPTSYQDYFDDRMRYGHGTNVAVKMLIKNRIYIDENIQHCPFPNFPPFLSICKPNTVGYSHRRYQELVSWNYPSSQYPACVADTPNLNTLDTLSDSIDVYTVRTLRHDYCECSRGARCHNGTISNRTTIVDWHLPRAWRNGINSRTNNFDQTEEYISVGDFVNKFTTPYSGYVSGRTFGIDIKFNDKRDNAPTFGSTEYSCHYSITKDIVQPSLVPSIQQATFPGTSTYADLTTDRTDVRNFFNTGPDFKDECGFETGDPTQCGRNEKQDTVATRPPRIVDSAEPSGRILEGHFANRCNCKFRAGHYARADQARSNDAYPFISIKTPFPYESDNTIDPADDDFYEMKNEDDFWYHDYHRRAAEMCCNEETILNGSDQGAITFHVKFYTLALETLVDHMTNNYRGNGFAIAYQSRFVGPFEDGFPLGAVTTIGTGYQLFKANPLTGATLFFVVYETINGIGNVPVCTERAVLLLNPLYKCLIDISYGFISQKWSTTENVRFFGDTLYQQRDVVVIGSGSIPSGSVGNAFVFISDSNQIVFGVHGLDTFVVVLNVRMGAENLETESSSSAAGHTQMQYTTPTYVRVKVIPTIEFLAFGRLDFGELPVLPSSIEITFRVYCPNINMDTDNDNILGGVGYCAQNWIITNQFNASIYMGVYGGPSTVSEPQTGLPSGFSTSDLLPDVLEDEDLTVRIKYNDGDVLSWYFFPKIEPEKPMGYAFCGYTDIFTPSLAPLMKAVTTVRVPTQRRAKQMMIAVAKGVPAACEFNKPEMYAAIYRGQPFVYGVTIAQNLPRYESIGRPLTYGPASNYWLRWDIGGKRLEGMSIFAQPYVDNSKLTLYDQKNVITDLVVGPPVTVVVYPNPLLRSVGCQNTNATCYTPNDDTNNTAYSGIDHNHYCINNQAGILLYTNLKYIPPFTEADQVGAIYCNKTTEFIDVFIQSQQTTALFGIVKELDVNETGYYTCTVRYGKSIEAILTVNFPCYERLITYAIVLIPFQPTPGTLVRIPACNRADNCCYQLPINVFGNTGSSEDIVNLASCSGTRAECNYEIVTTPPPSNDIFMGLCLGRTYTFTVRSPAVLVANREQATVGSFFQYPWRCPTTFAVTLPTLGFSAVDILVINGNCQTQASFIEMRFTYSNPLCTNAISLTNTAVDCRFAVYFAVEPVGNPSYTQSLARLSNPFPLINTVSYNSLFTINFPEILNDPAMQSLMDGVYDLYIWLAPASSPALSYAAASAMDARLAVRTQFVSAFDEANGLKIIRDTVTYPRCPATFTENNTLPIAAVSIMINITIIDTNWNGNYNLVFRTPSGRLIANRTITVEQVCSRYCGNLLQLANETCEACDIGVRVDGIKTSLFVGTGVSSPGEEGLYEISITSPVTGCTAMYSEKLIPLDTLVAQVSCRNQTCQYRRDGLVYSNVRGGTLIPLEITDLVQNSDLTIATPRHYYEWSVRFDNVTNTTKFVNQSYIPFATAGNYTLTATDFNGCTSQAQCVVAPENVIEVELAGYNPGNCSNAPGKITVQVKNNTGVPPYSLFEVGANPDAIATSQGYILEASSVFAGQLFLYTVCDSRQCCTPPLNLSLTAASDFVIRLAVQRVPCSEFLNSGIVTANVFPIGTGVQLQWLFNGVVIPSFSGNTFTAAAAGVYQVIGTNIFGCVASSTIVLNYAADLDADFSRTPPENDPGTMQGVVFGGNGPAFSMQIIPSDGLIFFLEQGPQFTSFRIEQLPASKTIKLRFTDVGGCVFEKTSTGYITPITTPPVIPSPSPVPVPVIIEKKNKTQMDYVFLLIACIGILGCLGVAIVIYDLNLRKNQKKSK